jgi:hypothetical protein
LGHSSRAGRAHLSARGTHLDVTPHPISGISCIGTLVCSGFSVRRGGEDYGQDTAEYAVILVLVVGTIRLISSNANNVFSAAASSIQ